MENTLRKILLAEDDRFMRKAADAALRHHGFTVITAGDGEEALRLARTEKPDLILLDLIMPKLHGFAVMRALKQDSSTSGIPIVVISNLEQASDLKTAQELGAIDYWVKANVGLDELTKRVETFLPVQGAV
jgi:two-component system OmpR family response regulator